MLVYVKKERQNGGGDAGVLTFFVRSKIIDPRGNVIEALDERVEGCISAQLDLDLTRYHRETYYCFLKDRRPDAYKDAAARVFCCPRPGISLDRKN